MGHLHPPDISSVRFALIPLLGSELEPAKQMGHMRDDIMTVGSIKGLDIGPIYAAVSIKDGRAISKDGHRISHRDHV